MTSVSAPPPEYYQFQRPEVQSLVPATATRILDVGCGAGRMGAGLKARQPCEVWGIELVQTVACQAAEVLDHVIVGSVDDSIVRAQLPEAYFDVIVCADVLEHLPDPESTLARLRSHLRPDGVLVVSLPNVRHWSVVRDLLEGRWEYQPSGILDRTHLRFFTRSSLIRMLEQCGFTVAQVQGVVTPDCAPPTQLDQTLRELGLNPDGFEQEARVVQFLVVARPGTQPDLRAEADPTFPARVNEAPPLASLVMLTHNQLEYTRQCVDSIFDTVRVPFELIAVDNGSSDGTLKYLTELAARHRQVRVVANPVNLGYGAGNNQGMTLARSEYVVLLNNDVVLTEGWLDRLIAHAQRPGIGLVGPRSNAVSGPQVLELLYSDRDELRRAARALAAERTGEHFELNRLVGFCLLVRREVLAAIGGFDERFGLGNFEDDDFCHRARLAGFACRVACDVFVHHFGSRTFAGEGIDHRACMEQGWEALKQKWGLEQEHPYDGFSLPRHPFERETGYMALPSAVLVPELRVEPDEPQRVQAARLSGCCNGLGERLYACARTEEAERLFQSALRFDERNADALNNLGVLALERGEAEQAIRRFESALVERDDHPDARWNLIAACMESGQQDRCRQWLGSC